MSQSRKIDIPSLKRDGHAYSEEELLTVASDLASLLQPGDRVLLEGEMGAGKSTFARGVLTRLGVDHGGRGSPSFAIAHEYSVGQKDLIHIDFYRLKSPQEIEEAGIESYFWERPEAVVLTEWLSRFEEFEKVIQRQPCWKVHLSIDASKFDHRHLTVEYS